MEFILGTAQLAGRYGVMATQEASEARAAAVLDTARRLGVSTLDTAPGYPGAEAAVGLAGTGFAVHTKLPSGEDPGTSLAASLRRLQREQVDVLHLHDPEVVLDAKHPLLDAAADLIGAGTAAVGASVYTREQFLAAVMDPRIAVVQAPMNVFDRRITDEDLRFAAESGTIIIARSALLQGLLGQPARAIGRVPQLDGAIAEFDTLCARLGRGPLELAIGWVRSRPAVSGIVLGAETPKQLEELVQATQSPPLFPRELQAAADLPLPYSAAVDPRTWSSS